MKASQLLAILEIFIFFISWFTFLLHVAVESVYIPMIIEGKEKRRLFCKIWSEMMKEECYNAHRECR